MTATPPTPLLVPAAPPAQGKRAAAPADNPRTGSFAQQLARQRGADEARPAASTPAKPAGGAKPAKEPGADTPETSAAADPATAAAGAAAVQAQAQTQAPQPQPATLPAQALEIAAQAAQLQQQAPAAAGRADAGMPAAPATLAAPAPAIQAAPAAPQAIAAALPAAAPAKTPAPHAKAPAVTAVPDARATARDARAAPAPAPQLAAAAPAGLEHLNAQAAADAEQALQGVDSAPQSTGHGGASFHVAVADTAAGLAAAAGIAARPDATAAALLQPAGPLMLGVATPVAANPAWGADLGRQLVVLSHDAARGQQTAELRLDPPDLGPLRVTLSVNDGVATASFVSAHAAVRHAVEAALPQLQQALAQAGLSLGQASVGEHGSQSGFDMQQQPQGRGHGQGGGAQGEAAVALAPATTASATRGDGLVDTFA